MEEQKFLEKEVGHMEQRLGVPVVDLKSRFDKTKLILPGSILMAALLISGSLIYTKVDSSKGVTGANIRQAPQAGAKVNVSADDDPFIGNAKAKVTVIEFSDFQCPFCRSMWRGVLSQMKKDYIDTGKIKFVYRDFPLLSRHPGAGPAAEGGNCAREQGKFWELHDKIFQEQDKQGQGTIQFSAQDVKKWAAAIGLDTAKFSQCLDSGKYKAEVAKDVADGEAAGVTGTPATFINGRYLEGAQPYSSFKALIDEELSKK